jgi:ribose transport system ATP-binding protein
VLPTLSNEPPAEPIPILQLSGITVHFAGVTALSGVTFDLHAGEIHCLMGENGAGKSTLSKVLSGVQLEYKGEVKLHGERVRLRSVRHAQDKKISMIHQELNLVPELSIFENIFLGREKRGVFGVQRARAMINETRQLLSELGSDLEPTRAIRELRVGARQLVEIAKALSLEAQVLIMDEPTSALSVSEVEKLFTVMRGLRARRRHHLHLAPARGSLRCS